ncbi:hypothetical protein TNCV_1860341 [Trichonephila clavipes]|nr:hypothetical protein TNCV_1860341 [Trichonephila clavipes]
MPQVRGSNPRLSKVDSTFQPFSGSINEYQACLGTEHWGLRQTDHLTETSVHALQRHDESTFEILQNKAQFVRRRRGEMFHSDCVVQSVKQPTKIMMWSVISGKGTGRGYSKTSSAAWREKEMTSSSACCRWNGIQDGGLAVSNRQEDKTQGRSYRCISRINYMGPPSYMGSNMCNYSPTNRAPIS